jgi:hypothetical protein
VSSGSAVLQPPTRDVTDSRRSAALAVSSSDPGDEERKLVRDDIKERLRLASPPLVKVVLATVKDQAVGAAARQARMDGKATSMLGAVGLSLTLLVSALVVNRGQPRSSSPFAYFLVTMAVLTALFSAFYALRALRVRNVKVLDKDEVLDRDILSEADDCGDDEGATLYERHIAFRLWLTVESMMSLQKQRADYLLWAQYAYFIFVAIVAVLTLVLVFPVVDG